MRQERAPISMPEVPTQPSLFRRSLHALEQHRKALAIALSTAALAFTLANPAPTNHESQGNTAPTTDNNPATLIWSQDLKNVTPEPVVITLAFWGGIIALVAGAIAMDNSEERNS